MVDYSIDGLIQSQPKNRQLRKYDSLNKGEGREFSTETSVESIANIGRFVSDPIQYQKADRKLRSAFSTSRRTSKTSEESRRRKASGLCLEFPFICMNLYSLACFFVVYSAKKSAITSQRWIGESSKRFSCSTRSSIFCLSGEISLTEAMMAAMPSVSPSA